MTTTAPSEPQQFLGGYWLLDQLSAGELCTVHRARSIVPSGERTEVALKRLRADGQDGQARARLLREARLGLVLRSPQLARVLEVHDEPELFVVMEYVEGATLRELLRRAPGRAALPHFAPMFVDALRGLSALHNFRDEEGAPGFLVHQVPSARHMLVGIDGVTRLIDFSHAHGRALSANPCGPKTSADTLAPEQRDGRTDLDPRCDIFLVGTALKEALTVALNHRAGESDEASLRAQCAPLFAIAERAAAEKRNERFWSADEMAYQLERAALGTGLCAAREAVGAHVRGVLGPVRQPRGLPRVNPRALEPISSASAPRVTSSGPRVTRFPLPPAIPPPPPVGTFPSFTELPSVRLPARSVQPPALPPSRVRSSAPTLPLLTPPSFPRVTPLPAPSFSAPRESALRMLPVASSASMPWQAVARSRVRQLGGMAGGIALLTLAFALGVRGFHDTATASAARFQREAAPAAQPAATAQQAEPRPTVTSLAPPPRARPSAAQRAQLVLTPPPAPAESAESEPSSELDEPSESTVDTMATATPASAESERSSRARPLFARPHMLRSELPVNPY